ncbi:hypothetical protein ABIF26_009579 [Bradyrhizobium elkanii]|uniref:DUF559 domain-containing protein n=1 Tax=Bradyrhizobium elkanii TaxID=29448 RepID=UPI0035181D3C
MKNEFSNFRSAIEWPASSYEDGLDADGYPIAPEPWRKPYIRGDESEAGDFKPASIGDSVLSLIERLGHAREIGGNCDSPIEEILGAAILMQFDRAGQPLKLCKMIDIKNAPDELVLVPQFAWGYYRSDWAILNPGCSGALLIECDGRDYHSTAEQRMHDWQKDANAHDRGYLTVRFTGSQINRNADSCARKIFDMVMA